MTDGWTADTVKEHLTALLEQIDENAEKRHEAAQELADERQVEVVKRLDKLNGSVAENTAAIAENSARLKVNAMLWRITGVIGGAILGVVIDLLMGQ